MLHCAEFQHFGAKKHSKERYMLSTYYYHKSCVNLFIYLCSCLIILPPTSSFLLILWGFRHIFKDHLLVRSRIKSNSCPVEVSENLPIFCWCFHCLMSHLVISDSRRSLHQSSPWMIFVKPGLFRVSTCDRLSLKGVSCSSNSNHSWGVRG